MKRFLPVLGVMTLLLAIIVVTVWSHEDAERWQPLPGGGEIAVHTVAYGVVHRVDHHRTGYMRRLQDAVSYRSWELLLRDEPPAEYGSVGNQPTFCVWFKIRGTSKEPVLAQTQLVLPDGQIYYGSWKASSWRHESGLIASAFSVLPYTVQKVKTVTIIDGRRFDWEIVNPTYDPLDHRAAGEPLPQSRQVGRFEVTLHEITLEPSDEMPSNWLPQVHLTISADGEDVSRGFHVSSSISDRGLLSAKSWVVRTSLSRDWHYPFAPEEIEWVGTFIRPEGDSTKPEQYVLFPLSDVAIGRGLKFVGIFAAGRYEFRDDKVSATQALSDVEATNMESATVLPGSVGFQVTLKEPTALVLKDEKGKRTAWFLRDAAGNAARPPAGVERVGAFELMMFGLSESPVRFGIADLSPPVTEGDRFLEFVVRPPQIPPEANLGSNDLIMPKAGSRARDTYVVP